MADALPKYLQIAKDLQRQIEEGTLKAGDRLPTESELAARWKVSTSTVKDALSELRKSGRVQTRPREGTFVLPRRRPLTITLNDRELDMPQVPAESRMGGGEGRAFRQEAERQGFQATWDLPEVTVGPAEPWQLEAFGLPPDQRVQIVQRKQRRFIDGEPNSLQYSYFTLELALKAPLLLNGEDIEQGHVAYLAELGFVQVGYLDEFNARPPHRDEAEFFGLSRDSLAVIEHSRTAYDQDGKPFRLTVTVYRPRSNKIRFYAGKVPPSVLEGS